MSLPETYRTHGHQVVTNRFVAACQSDPRILAAFLGGSYATGTADEYSDLDFFVIATDEAYDSLLSERKAFIRLLGDPLFLEDFGTPHCMFFVLADGTEAELWIGSQGHWKHLYGGAYRALLDKHDILTGVVLPAHRADHLAQVETLRQQIYWFWHDFSHFLKALGRGQLWSAYGSMEVLRGICVNLARLRHDFEDAGVGEEPYFKIEHVLPAEQLEPLTATCCPMEWNAIYQAGHILLQVYRDAAIALAQAHAIPYPAPLERLMVSRFEEMGGL